MESESQESEPDQPRQKPIKRKKKPTQKDSDSDEVDPLNSTNLYEKQKAVFAQQHEINKEEYISMENKEHMRDVHGYRAGIYCRIGTF